MKDLKNQCRELYETKIMVWQKELTKKKNEIHALEEVIAKAEKCLEEAEKITSVHQNMEEMLNTQLYYDESGVLIRYWENNKKEALK